MLVIYVKRKRDFKVNPQSSPSAYYGKPPRTPQSLLTMLQDTSSDDKHMSKEGMDDIGNHSVDKLHHLEPGTEQFYNMSRSISTDHVHEQALTPFTSAVAMTTARAAPSLPTAHVRSISSQNNFNPMFPPTTGITVGTVGAARIPPVTMGAARPESYARPISEYQRDTNSFYNNDYTSREMIEVPGRQSPYNPFRNSEIGVAATNSGNMDYNNTSTATFVSASSRHVPTHYTENNNSGSPLAGESVSYGNIPLATPSVAAISSAAAVGGATALLKSNQGHQNNYSSDQKEANTFDSNGHTAPSSEIPQKITPSDITSASMTGASALDPVSKSQVAKNVAPENVRWTNAPSSKDALATAFLIGAPTIAVHESDNQQYNDQHYDQHKDQENYQHNDEHNDHAIGSSPLSVNKEINKQVSSSNVQWTHNNVSNALGVATVEPDLRESTYQDHDSFYSPLPLHIGSSSNRSLLTTVDATSEGLSSDPDIARWTTAPPPNISTAKIETVPTNRNQYHSPLTPTPTWPAIIESGPLEDDTTQALPVHMNDDANSYKDDVNTKVIHKNAFRLSDAGSLPPIDTNMFSNQVVKESNHQDTLLSPDSAVRWKTANIGSPIETAQAVNILSPASATVIQRSVNEDENDLKAFEDYYHPKPQQIVAAPMPSSSTSSKNKKYKPVVNVNVNTKEQMDQEPIGRKSEAIDDVIANRDLNALSMIIQDEEDESISPLYNNTPLPTSIRKEAGASLGPGAMDGRASSKRMVEEYFSSRNKAPEETTKDKKSKYKSDFKSIMAAAIQNNTKFPIATEDKPHLYYAKFDFSAREHGELGFGKADPIIVVDSSDDIWWMGYKADSKFFLNTLSFMFTNKVQIESDGSFIQGVFPSNYVEIAVELR